MVAVGAQQDVPGLGNNLGINLAEKEEEIETWMASVDHASIWMQHHVHGIE